MRTSWKCALVLAVLAVGVGATQPGGPIAPEGTTVPLLLLRQKSVQQELKLDDAAVKKIMDFTNQQADEYKKALKSQGAERDKAVDGLEAANKKFLEDNLTPAQSKRLDQITLQVTGLQQLTRPDVAKALNLTDEQQTKFKALAAESAKAVGDLLNAVDGAGRNEKLAKLREENHNKIVALLTDEQKTKAKEMVGEPFKGKLVIEDPPKE